MELKNIQRYTSTYIHYVFNDMKRLLKDKRDIEFIDTMIAKNSLFIQEQNNRRTKDSYPILHFTAYELLANFRNFMENYEKFLSEDAYTESFRKTDFENEFCAGISKEDMYFLKIIKPKDDMQIQDISEKKVLRQIRNADAHGDIEILLDSWEIGRTIIKFKVNTKNIQMIEIGEREFIKIVSVRPAKGK